MSERSTGRLQILAAALIFSAGGAGIKACELTPWQVASFRSGIAAVVVLLLMPEARRGWSWRVVVAGLQASPVDRRGVAPVLAHLDDLNLRQRAARDVDGIVAGAVVDHHDADQIDADGTGAQGPQRRAHDVGTVVGHHDDRNPVAMSLASRAEPECLLERRLAGEVAQ